MPGDLLPMEGDVDRTFLPGDELRGFGPPGDRGMGWLRRGGAVVAIFPVSLYFEASAMCCVFVVRFSCKYGVSRALRESVKNRV